MILVDCINDLGFIMRIIVRLVYYVRILVPIILILLIVVDLAKVVTGNADDKAKSEAMNKAGKRIIYAVIIFLVPLVVNFIFKRIEQVSPDKDNGTPTSWVGCWNYFNDEMRK